MEIPCSQITPTNQREARAGVQSSTGKKWLAIIMDASSAKPRVNGSMLAKHVGQYVCLVGKNIGVSLLTWIPLTPRYNLWPVHPTLPPPR